MHKAQFFSEIKSHYFSAKTKFKTPAV